MEEEACGRLKLRASRIVRGPLQERFGYGQFLDPGLPHPDYRRRGIARALVAEVEKRLFRQGGQTHHGRGGKGSSLGHRLWEAVGYDLDSRIFRYVRNL